MKRLNKDFFNRHPLKQISAQRFLFSILCYPGFETKVDPLCRGNSNEDMQKVIAAEGNLDRQLRLLRTSLMPAARERLRADLLKHEPETLTAIFDALPKAFNDIFVENAVHILVDCDADPCSWIIEHFEEIRYPYTASALCLVLGFRFGPESIPFLIEKLEYYSSSYPTESFDQAPLLALHHLAERFADR